MEIISRFSCLDIQTGGTLKKSFRSRSLITEIQTVASVFSLSRLTNQTPSGRRSPTFRETGKNKIQREKAFHVVKPVSVFASTATKTVLLVRAAGLQVVDLQAAAEAADLQVVAAAEATQTTDV